MPVGHFSDAGGYIDHGDAKGLFPIEDLSATVHRYRDAQLALNTVDRTDVAVVRPTGLASSYALTKRPLTAIEVASIDGELLARMNDASGLDIASFTLIQVGRKQSAPVNHSLAEYRR